MDAQTRIHFIGSPTLHSSAARCTLSGGGNYSGDTTGVTIDTTQYGTEDPATIVFDAAYVKQSNTNPGAMNVTGCGTVVFNSVSMFSGGLTVSDSATVAVNADKKPGNGAVTVHDDATLEVAESGTVTLGGDLSLADGVTLAFNFTERTTAPTLSIASDKTVTANGKVKVKVTAPTNFHPSVSANVLTSGGKFAGVSVELVEDGKPDWATGVSVVDGNIVLGIKPAGLVFFVK